MLTSQPGGSVLDGNPGSVLRGNQQWSTLLLSVMLYIVVPVILAAIIRRAVLRKSGEQGLARLLHRLGPASLSALLLTLVLLFGFQGRQIVDKPLIIAMLAVPIVIQVYFNSGLAYWLNRKLGVAHCVAGPSALIGASWIDIPFQALMIQVAGGVNKFSLLAIPFYVLAGAIMERAGIAERLINFVKECVGSITGGLAIGAILVATFWGAISGSGPATVAVIGVIMIPGMVAAGYDKAFATAVVSSASGIAIIIPPSISFIVYASITGTSIGAMFA